MPTIKSKDFPPVIQAELLCEACVMLWGPTWKSKLAHETGANLRSVQRWAIGQNEVPDWVRLHMVGKLASRSVNFMAMARRFE